MRVGDIITKIVEIATAPFEPLAEAINNFVKDFANTLKEGIEMIIKHFEEEFKTDIEKVIPKELFEEEHFKEWKDYIEKEAGKKPVPLAPIIAMLAGSAIGTGVGMGFGGFGRNIQNFFNSRLTPTPLNPAECAYYIQREPTDTETVKKNLLANGYPVDYHYYLLQMYKPKLTPTEIATAYMRGIIDEEQFNYLLEEHGLSERDRDYLKEIIWAYPSPTDFIRFAVRDVFVKDEKTREALSAEFPEDIVEYAEKAGMRRDVLMWYWMAHWELPSPTQVYEMLHRLNPEVLKVRGGAYKEMGLDLNQLETTKETVEFYLKQADYDKRWRQRLLAISYYPLTRVDLRRIYQLGLIDDNELLARLMEIGYTKKDAELLLEFYKTFRQEEVRLWTKTEIRNLLYYGLVNDAEAVLLLQRLGYTEEDAKTLVDLWKAKLAEKDMRETQKYVRDAYSLGTITMQEAEKRLRDVGVSEETVKIVLDKEDARRLGSVKLPSASTVVKWLKAGIITESEAKKILEEINVKKEYIPYYIAEGKANA